MCFIKKKNIEGLVVKETTHKIEINEKILLDDVVCSIKLTYENDPINLRRLEIIYDEERTQLGFFNHSLEENLGKKFFSMIDPYLN